MPLEVQETTTALQVKGMISQLIPFPASQQRLIFAGWELTDTSTLSSYNVVEDELLLVIRRGFLHDFRESVQKVETSLQALQTHSVVLPLHVENLAQSVTELRKAYEEIENSEERLDEFPHGPWAYHRTQHVWAE
jgi:hypothetical protein